MKAKSHHCTLTHRLSKHAGKRQVRKAWKHPLNLKGVHAASRADMWPKGAAIMKVSIIQSCDIKLALLRPFWINWELYYALTGIAGAISDFRASEPLSEVGPAVSSQCSSRNSLRTAHLKTDQCFQSSEYIYCLVGRRQKGSSVLYCPTMFRGLKRFPTNFLRKGWFRFCLVFGVFFLTKHPCVGRF